MTSRWGRALAAAVTTAALVVGGTTATSAQPAAVPADVVDVPAFMSQVADAAIAQVEETSGATVAVKRTFTGSVTVKVVGTPAYVAIPGRVAEIRVTKAGQSDAYAALRTALRAELVDRGLATIAKDAGSAKTSVLRSSSVSCEVDGTGKLGCVATAKATAATTARKAVLASFVTHNPGFALPVETGRSSYAGRYSGYAHLEVRLKRLGSTTAGARTTAFFFATPKHGWWYSTASAGVPQCDDLASTTETVRAYWGTHCLVGTIDYVIGESS